MRLGYGFFFNLMFKVNMSERNIGSFGIASGAFALGFALAANLASSEVVVTVKENARGESEIIRMQGTVGPLNELSHWLTSPR